MSADKYNIPLTLIYQGENYPIQTYVNEYHSLMTLISNHLAVVGFGLCCGMRSCGTCMVEIGNKYSSVTIHVLACDIPINDELSNTEITIPDQRY
ncbi:MAG: 2Fe-2S iron-sulfur cluster binding protein [Mucilaginibacter sp.]|jgi:aerobic-type carbon monoxide dehydrogenase small subunit (CoxS/CutS family)|nr:2Fe-2S iron-sulfur cluster binding protein [Mucilaginibacter sp.]